MSGFKTIVVPYDFSAHAEAALDLAADLGRQLGSDVHLVHVIQPPTFAYGIGTYGAAEIPVIDMSAVREGAQKSLRSLGDRVERVLDRPIGTHVIEGAGIVDMLQEAAAELDADLIVMGTHGRTGLAHVFLGSVAERTLRRASCPVVTVRAADTEVRDLE